MRPMVLLSCLLFFCFACCGSAFALSPQYEAGFQYGLRSIYDSHPRYRLGGILDDGETDCSELMREAATKGRLPGISRNRLQAWQIYKGHGGFANKAVPDWKNGDTRGGDLLCVHVKDGLERPYGINHILAIIKLNGVHKVIHASSSRKTVVIIPFQEWIEKALPADGYRRMTLGEEQ